MTPPAAALAELMSIIPEGAVWLRGEDPAMLRAAVNACVTMWPGACLHSVAGDHATLNALLAPPVARAGLSDWIVALSLLGPPWDEQAEPDLDRLLGALFERLPEGGALILDASPLRRGDARRLWASALRARRGGRSVLISGGDAPVPRLPGAESSAARSFSLPSSRQGATDHQAPQKIATDIDALIAQAPAIARGPAGAAWTCAASSVLAGGAELSAGQAAALRLRLGRAIRYEHPILARALLDAARHGCLELGDRLGALSCLAFVVETHYIEWEDLRALDELCDDMLALADADAAMRINFEDSLEIQTRLAIAMLVAGRAPDRLMAVLGRVHALRARSEDPTEQALAATVLLEHHLWHPAVIDREVLWSSCAPRCDDDRVAPIVRVWWAHRAIAAGHGVLEVERIAGWKRDAATLAQAHGLHHTVRFLDHSDTELLLAAGDLPAARQRIDRMLMSLRQRCRLDLVYHHVLETLWHLRAENFTAAVDHAMAAHREAVWRGLPAMQWPHVEVIIAFAHLGRGQLDEADRWFAKAVEHAGQAPGCREQREFALAHARWIRGDEEGARATLRVALAASRQRRAPWLMKYLPGVAAVLADLALEADIEAPHVRRLIAAQGLLAPDPASPHWAWPIAIHSLGGVTQRRHGMPVRDAKRLHKPSLLLARLLCAGADGVRREDLEEDLWDDPDMSSPEKALDIAVHRLRRWLGDDAAVIVSGGRVSLDEVRVWTDVQALRHMQERLDGATPPGAREARRWLGWIDRLCVGAFCAGIEADTVLAARARHEARIAALRERLTRLALREPVLSRPAAAPASAAMRESETS